MLCICKHRTVPMLLILICLLIKQFTLSCLKKTFFMTNFVQDKNVGVINGGAISLGLLTPQGPPFWHPARDDIKQACRQAAEYCQVQYNIIPNKPTTELKCYENLQLGSGSVDSQVGDKLQYEFSWGTHNIGWHGQVTKSNLFHSLCCRGVMLFQKRGIR